MPDLMRLMHRSFRESKAPHLRALLSSLERGIKMLNPRGFVAGLYLPSARENALQDWADTYAIPSSGRSDEELREDIRRDALTRNQTTEDAIETAILKQTGVSASVRPSLPHVAFYDQQERVKPGYRMADYYRHHREDTGLLWGEAWGGQWPGISDTYAEDDPSHLGFRGLTPRREGFGPGGFIVYMACPYNENIERDVLAILNEQAPAMKGYTVFWVHTFSVSARNTLRIGGRELLHPLHGWGCAPWGRAWGSPIVTAEACPPEP